MIRRQPLCVYSVESNLRNPLLIDQAIHSELVNEP